MSVKLLFVVVVCLACFTPRVTSSAIGIAEAVGKTIQDGMATKFEAKKEIMHTISEGHTSCLDGMSDVVKGVVKIKKNIIGKTLNICKTIVSGAIKVGASIITNKIALLSSPHCTTSPCNHCCSHASKPTRDVVYVNDVDYYRVVPLTAQHPEVNSDEQENVTVYY